MADWLTNPCNGDILRCLIKNRTFSKWSQNRRRPMKKRRRFPYLSQKEREFHEVVLMEEINLQSWYTIVYSAIFNEEIILTTQ
jgi:hypothetical protein